MSAVTQWPPKTRDTGAVIAAYERVLGWPLIVDATLVSAERATAELRGNTGAELSTTCSAFDAVTVSYPVGVDMLVLLGRQDLDLVPCLTDGHDQAVFLVRAGSGEALTAMAGVSVDSGPGGRLVLPPSPRRRWDTPPWSARAEEPSALPAGTEIEPCLRAALRLFGGSSP
ncbi:hypothetical protein [Streptomyces sp. NBC_01006]|uniref:hypothetical protein n=1 Tax=Streptomyces sp. NBC_01006 TaxID=2903716 RepID=UPI00386796C6|nr:hypothetical protein OG509_32935 [Streptomyces sp. NBC_01006]